jgi:hypothetical protein
MSGEDRCFHGLHVSMHCPSCEVDMAEKSSDTELARLRAELTAIRGERYDDKRDEASLIAHLRCGDSDGDDHDQAAALIESLRAEVERLRGDLNIARLERDAKLCSECPRNTIIARLEAEAANLRNAVAAHCFVVNERDRLLAQVERLEAELNRLTRGDVSPIITTLGDALTYIARLEAELTEAKAFGERCFSDACASQEKARDEIERLEAEGRGMREALLRLIGDIEVWYGLPLPHRVAVGVDEARAALTAKPGEGK